MNSSPSSAAGPEDAVPEPHPAPAGTGVHHGFYQWIRSLGVIRGADRWFGGVASGVAARTGLDPVLVRGLFIVLGVFGVGLLVYGVAWALLPEPDGRIHLEEAARGSWTSGMTGAVVFALLGMGGPGASFLGGDSWFGAVIWTLFWIGAGVAAVYWFSTGKGRVHLSGHGAAAADPSGTPDTAGTSGPADGAVGQAPEASPGKPVTLAKPQAGTAGTGSAAAAPLPAGGAAPAAGTHRGFAVPSGPGLPSEPAPSPAPDSKRSTKCGGKAKVPGVPGSFAAALFGAALLAGGTVLALEYFGILALGAPVSVALAAAGAVLGIGIVVLGLLGRHSGGIGTAAVAALVAALLTQGSWANANMTVAGEADWAPRDAAEASGGYSAVAGNGVLDLRTTESTGDFEVPASVAMGNIDIIVPEDSPVTVRFGMAAGNVELHDASDHQFYAGLWQPGAEHTLNDDADGDRITIDLRGLASNVLVTTDESDL